jgi:predicted transcriptional regulator
MVLCSIISNQRTISFRVDEDKIEALDELAVSFERDRSYLLNEAVANYLELQAYHASLIKEGLKAVKDGRTLGTAEVRKKITKWARARRSE